MVNKGDVAARVWGDDTFELDNRKKESIFGEEFMRTAASLSNFNFLYFWALESPVVGALPGSEWPSENERASFMETPLSSSELDEVEESAELATNPCAPLCLSLASCEIR